MLLLFILIGLLALGLPLMLMLFGDPPAPPAPPVQAKPAIVQPALVAAPIEVPQAASSDTPTPATPATAEVPQAAPIATTTTQAPPAAVTAATQAASKAGISLADPIQIPSLPEGT